jgi:hypothetical protein
MAWAHIERSLPMLGAQASTLGALGTSRELTLTPLGSMSHANTSLNDAVVAAGHGAVALGGLQFQLGSSSRRRRRNGHGDERHVHVGWEGERHCIGGD